MIFIFAMIHHRYARAIGANLKQVYRAFSATSKPNMPPIFDKPTTEKYDYVVIGGGSGGSGSSVSDCFRRRFI